MMASVGSKVVTAARPDTDTSSGYASVSACCFLSVAAAQLSVPVQVAGSAPSQPAGAAAASASWVSRNKPLWQHFHQTLIFRKTQCS